MNESSTPSTPATPTAGTPADTAFFGHPRGLSTLFFTELWERFSYYGMRAILILFMTAPVAAGGLGFEVTKAGAIYGAYVSLVYLLALPGGWLADRIMGLRNAVLYGGVIIMLGHISLAVPTLGSFYLGLALIVIGTGLLKPCISALVGTLYSVDDMRRDAGFSIYYMGINLGAFLAPLAVGFLAQHQWFQDFLVRINVEPETSWHWGFALAAFGMGAGLIQYLVGGKHLGDAGLRPVILGSAENHARLKTRVWTGIVVALVGLGVVALLANSGVITVDAIQVAGAFGVVILGITIGFFSWLFLSGGWTPEERKRLLVITILFVASAVFWSAFEQAGSSLNLFAENQTDTTILGISFPASWLQSVNSLFIILLAPVFAYMWIRLAKNDPSTPTKFTFGLVLVGAGFGVMMMASLVAAGGNMVSPWWLILTYLLHTCGELCLSPVGLSAMTKLAPARVTGLMMGAWFLSISVGGYMAGGVVTLYESFTLPQIFGTVAAFAIVAGLILAVFIKPTQRLLSKPSDESAAA